LMSIQWRHTENIKRRACGRQWNSGKYQWPGRGAQPKCRKKRFPGGGGRKSCFQIRILWGQGRICRERGTTVEEGRGGWWQGRYEASNVIIQNELQNVCPRGFSVHMEIDGSEKKEDKKRKNSKASCCAKREREL